MKSSIYVNLERKIVAVTLLVSLAPLVLLGFTLYSQYFGTWKTKIEEQILFRARSQAQAIDLFLKERTAILSAMADTHGYQEIADDRRLRQILEIINKRAGAFVDLGVINSAGQQVAYVGPYELKGLNYYQQTWFGEVMGKGVYISDVYLGYRQLPHFIIAVRRQGDPESWILRATIDPDIFGGIVRAAQVGKTGDAYIVNREGLCQTTPRLCGDVMGASEIHPRLFGGSATVLEQKNAEGKSILYAGSWLNQDKWLLVISEEAEEEMRGLLATRNTGTAIILSGILAIILATVFTTRSSVNRLRNSDARMSELNAQLVQSDKLAALGKMAAGVAHEINNPLAVILQKTGWMEDLLEEEELRESENLEEFRDSIRKIEEHVERARKVVHNMLGYARKMEPRLEDVDVNQTLRQTITLMDNYARINNIEIRTNLAPELPIIAGDQSRLQQVFLNLINNAIDAIRKDGFVQVTSRRLGDSIELEVADNGPGVPKDKQNKVFDPFFTTKEAGKGTGLGLWISYDIITKMGGSIRLESREGEGATFTVRIPIVLPEKK